MSGWRSWFIGGLVAAALVGVVLHLAELRAFVVLLQHVNPIWLLLALAFQLTTYVSLAMGWRAVLHQAEHRHYRLWPLVRIALCKLFADQALPTAGMGGNVLLVDQLVAIGARRGTAMAALLLTMRGFYGAYLAFSVVTLFLLWLHGHATPLMVGFVTAFVLVALAIPAFALWLRRSGSRPLPGWVERVRPIRQLLETIGEAPAALLKDKRLFRRLLVLNGLIFAADGLTMFACLKGLGLDVPFSTALVAFMLASMAATLGPVPLGLGSFEVVSTSTLALLGVRLEPAIAATMLLRILILWLPLLPGLALTRRMLGKKAPPKPRAAR